MDRAERRRRDRQARKLFVDPEGVASIRGTGMDQHITGSLLDRLLGDDPDKGIAEGEHAWQVFISFRIRTPSEWFAGDYHLDIENMSSVTGPGCYRCEQPWSEELEAAPCPGHPPGELRHV